MSVRTSYRSRKSSRSWLLGFLILPLAGIFFAYQYTDFFDEILESKPNGIETLEESPNPLENTKKQPMKVVKSKIPMRSIKQGDFQHNSTDHRADSRPVLGSSSEAFKSSFDAPLHKSKVFKQLRVSSSNDDYAGFTVKGFLKLRSSSDPISKTLSDLLKTKTSCQLISILDVDGEPTAQFIKLLGVLYKNNLSCDLTQVFTDMPRSISSVKAADRVYEGISSQASKYGLRSMRTFGNIYLTTKESPQVLSYLSSRFNSVELKDPLLNQHAVLLYINKDHVENLWIDTVQDEYDEFVNLLNHITSFER